MGPHQVVPSPPMSTVNMPPEGWENHVIYQEAICPVCGPQRWGPYPYINPRFSVEGGFKTFLLTIHLESEHGIMPETPLKFWYLSEDGGTLTP